MPGLSAMPRRAALKWLLTVTVTAFGMVMTMPGPAKGQPIAPSASGTRTVPGPVSDGRGPGRRVLLLYTEPRLGPAVVAIDTRVRSVLESRSPGPITFYTEYLDLNLFEGDAPQPELRELLRRKYASRPIELIVAAGSRALRVALQNRADLFSSAPIVFVAVDPKAAANLRLDADVTGTWLRIGWKETVELARQLQPETRRAVVVGGGVSDRPRLDGPGPRAARGAASPDRDDVSHRRQPRGSPEGGRLPS
jgi:hypothetical protein